MRRLLSVALVLLAAGCAPAITPFDVSYVVFPTDGGADVLVQVTGGPPDVAWVGFGVGPGSPASILDRVHSVEARTADGTPLEIRTHAGMGFEILTMGAESWTLSYGLDLDLAAGDPVFYRSSIRTDDYLVLVGSDAWARFYTDAESIAVPPENRSAGPTGAATVTFHLPEEHPDWRVMTTAVTVTPTAFRLPEHPVGSVFVLGDFDIDVIEAGGGLRLATNTGWSLLRDRVVAMTATLRTALSERLDAVPAARPALALLLPLPAPLRPFAGLRTAGMVRGDTVLLYADASPHRPDDEQILTAMAVFLGHELFHLYVPSTVVVNRELSWLSEGWAMHMGRLAALDAGWIREDGMIRGLEETYRRYLDFGGYRAGSLPAASMGSESQRDLLYLRGELVFRLLSREWHSSGRVGSFEAALWQRLAAAYDGGAPLTSEQVETIVADLVGPGVVRRYVEGTAPLTQSALGLGPAGR